MTTATKIDLNALVSKLRAAQAQTKATPTLATPAATATPATSDGITYNAEQLAFIQSVLSGQDSILLGPAGTGKTTAVRGALLELLQSSRLHSLAASHKYLSSEAPGIAFVSFTNKAVKNLRAVVPSNLKDNAITIHKLLEYQPTVEEYFDEEEGIYKNRRIFQPNRHELNPLPATLSIIIIDEISMVEIPLFEKLMRACPHNPQIVFIGDIFQLTPVFGASIVTRKLLSSDTTTTTLNRVYRQALESPIIRLATAVRQGTTVSAAEFASYSADPEQLQISAWPKPFTEDAAMILLANNFKSAYHKGTWNPLTDQILMPYNKSFGTIELNKWLATHIAQAHNRPVYEIITGFTKLYLSVGDKVSAAKEEAVVTAIVPNASYHGVASKEPSEHLNYWGDYSESHPAAISDFGELDLDSFLDLNTSDESEDKKAREASHLVTIQYLDSGETETLNTVGDLTYPNFYLSYAITVHKAQGSQWPKVFYIVHHTNYTSQYRELLYTAITRAQKSLIMIIPPDHLVKAVKSQRIPGNTTEEKLENLKIKLAGEML